jgi:hypothetical protein
MVDIIVTIINGRNGITLFGLLNLVDGCFIPIFKYEFMAQS